MCRILVGLLTPKRSSVDFDKRGKMALGAVRQAMRVIQNGQESNGYTVTEHDDPHASTGKSVSTDIDIAAQRVYTNLFEAEDPESGIKAEEKDPLLQTGIKPGKPTWVVDGLDGSSQFVANTRWGYGTQCALLLPDGSVAIALVGDATTGDIFGYYGKSGVFRINKHGKRTMVEDVVRDKTLLQLGGLRRPPNHEYHELSRRLLLSGLIGTVNERKGGIGSTMAGLLTDEIGIFALRGHREKPWDAIPAYALCIAAGMVFLTPSACGTRLIKWDPVHTLDEYDRTLDLLVVHRSRLAELHEAVLNCA